MRKCRDEDGVAIWRTFRHRVRTDDCTCPRFIFDNHCLSKILRHCDTQGTSNRIRPPAWRKRDNDPDRPICWVILRRDR